MNSVNAAMTRFPIKGICNLSRRSDRPEMTGVPHGIDGIATKSKRNNVSLQFEHDTDSCLGTRCQMVDKSP